jgi:hypothetical protein
MTKIAGSGSISQRHGSADPDPLVRGMDPRIRIHWSEAWIRGSGSTPKCHGSATLLTSTESTVLYKIFSRTTGPPTSDPRRASVSGDLVSSSWERTGRRSPAHQRRHASAREAGCPAPPRSPRCLLMTPGGASVESVFEDPEEETYSYLEVG